MKTNQDRRDDVTADYLFNVLVLAVCAGMGL